MNQAELRHFTDSSSETHLTVSIFDNNSLI